MRCLEGWQRTSVGRGQLGLRRAVTSFNGGKVSRFDVGGGGAMLYAPSPPPTRSRSQERTGEATPAASGRRSRRARGFCRASFWARSWMRSYESQSATNRNLRLARRGPECATQRRTWSQWPRPQVRWSRRARAPEVDFGPVPHRLAFYVCGTQFGSESLLRATTSRCMRNSP